MRFVENWRVIVSHDDTEMTESLYLTLANTGIKIHENRECMMCNIVPNIKERPQLGV